MHFTSSPLEYPPTSSPIPHSPHKKRKLHNDREPLTNLSANGQGAPSRAFLDEDSDDDSQDLALWKQRKVIAQQAHLEVQVVQPSVITANKVQQNVSIRDERRPSSSGTGVLKSFIPVAILEESTTALETISSLAPQHSIQNCSGKTFTVRRKTTQTSLPYQKIVSNRSTEIAGRAQKSYYGVDIHRLIDEGTKENTALAASRNTVELETESSKAFASDTAQADLTPTRTLLWTEKYRARKFTDLVGDERTHRSVLRWLKAWDTIVFPSSTRPKISKKKNLEDQEPEKVHRKVLLLTGPPGLGKTTLAHVCAKQAGYEVQEINASDERSKDTVKGRIRDMVCTENVRPADMSAGGKTKRTSRPVCVVVDEVDGVVSGSGTGGDGGFIKALVDLLVLDQKNSMVQQRRTTSTEPTHKKKRGDNFRLLRPLILICNDLYHPSLRILRQGTLAEVIYVRKPPLNMIIPRLQRIFVEEGIPCDSDGIRHLCEATWGVSTRKENKSSNGTADGDMRGILVVGEWVASKLRAERNKSDDPIRLTKRWIQESVLCDLAHGGGAARSLGRGGSKEVVDRVFSHNAGFPTTAPSGQAASLNTADAAKERTMQRLAEMIESSGEDDRIITDCFASYPTCPFQDDTYLSKPTAAYEWLYFHDTLSTALHSAQEWELGAYLTSPVLAFHHLFASTSPFSHGAHGGNAKTSEDPASDTTQPHQSDANPFTGPRASYAVHEALKASQAQLTHLQSSLSLPLLRSFRSPADLATDLLPYVLRTLNPDVKPVVVGGSGDKGIASVRRGPEKEMVLRGVDAMIACGLKFERSKVEWDAGSGATEAGSATAAGWVYRMEPAVDALGVFETMSAGPGTSASSAQKVRFAVRQVLDQEWKRETARREQEARVRRGKDLVSSHNHGKPTSDDPTRGTTSDETSVSGARPHGRPSGLKAVATTTTKRDFFGRPIVVVVPRSDIADNGDRASEQGGAQGQSGAQEGRAGRVWVTFHEGFSNAVRKPITLRELMEGL